VGGLRRAPLAAYVAGTFVLLLGYNYYAGLRHDSCFSEVAIDSVEELGIGLVVAVLVLWLLAYYHRSQSRPKPPVEK
jgi:uncharacterized membrane protein